MPDIAAVSATSPFPSTRAQEAAAQTQADSDMFLKLLVAQMRFQNPMEPMDGTEFIAQSAQLATVEALQSLVTTQASAQVWAKTTAAHQMVGTQVEALTDTGEVVTGIGIAVRATADGPRLTLLTPDDLEIDVAVDNVRSSTLLAAAAPPPVDEED